MKQLLFILFTFWGVCSWGQRHSVATFDFTQPTGVTPQINLPSNLSSMDISTDKFSDGNIKLSFVKGVNQYLGAQYSLNKKSDSKEYFLQLYRGAYMDFNATGGAFIDSIKFEVVVDMYDITLVNDSPGNLSSERYKRFWSKNNNETVTAVSFMNVGKASEIRKAIVYYQTPSAVLFPSSTDISSSYLTNFSQASLSFDRSITISSSNGAYISNYNGVVQSLTLSAKGNLVTLSVSNAIATDGQYTIYIPEGCIWDASGYCNKALTYNFTISTPKNTLTYTTATPAEGEIDKLSSPIVLEFDKHLMSISNNELYIYKDGAKAAKAKIERSSTSSKDVIISFDIPEGLTEKGIYTLTINEGIIKDQLEETYNPTFTLTYKVGYEKEPEASETYLAAKNLISKTGVGYPADDSEARIALKNLVEQVPFASDEELTKAMLSFYSEKNITMPETGKYYTISNISQNNKVLYISVDDEENVSLTSNKAKATAFLSSCEDGKYTFQTQGGKYFFVNGLTSDKGKSLDLKKFSLSGVDDKLVLGTFSIYGYCTTNSEDTELNAYALVNHSTGKISTDVTASSLHFNEKQSNAFMFTETAKPAEGATAVDFHMSLICTEFTDDNGILELSTAAYSGLSLNPDKQNASLLNKEQKEIGQLNMTLGNNGNVKIPFSQLSNDTYYVKVSKGSILGVKDGQTYTNKEFTVPFTVKKQDIVVPDNPEFDYSYNSFWYVPFESEYYHDIDLNGFSITDAGDFDGFVVNESKTIELVQPDTYRTVKTGHFKKIDYLPGYPEYTNAYQIEFDSPIKSGDLKPDRYVFVLPIGTFGDNNYAKYLSDPTSISPSKCKVNPVMRIVYKVNNDKATSIDEITTDSNKPSVIYDLMGRRVQNMSRPGIYIVNGKKVVKK